MSTPTHKVNSIGVSSKSLAVSLIERQEPSEPYLRFWGLAMKLEDMTE